jgi:uncharacterized membrane protein YdjX (TVP38/TMEM64 family)
MGLATSLAATVLAAMLIFYIARWTGRRYVQRRLGARLVEVRRVMKEHGVLAMILIRQLPMTALMGNLLCAVSGVRARHYFIGSLIGLFPGALIFTLFGAGVRRHFGLRASGASLLLFVLTFGTLLVLNRTTWLKPLWDLLKRRSGE